MNNLANLNLNNFVILSAILFSIGVSGMFLNRKNIISLLMSIELMLLAVNINFVAFSAFLHDLVGQIFAIFVLTVAGAEAAIGLAILVIYFQNRHTIEIKSISSMKG
jgi:NADH-quinone oxidoreductase subunit K